MSRMNTAHIVISGIVNDATPDQIAAIAARSIPPEIDQRLRDECADESLPVDTLREYLVRECRECVSRPEPHAKPGQFCPTCGETHCIEGAGHEWSEYGYCVKCGADGAA